MRGMRFWILRIIQNSFNSIPFFPIGIKVQYGGCVLGSLESRTIVAHYKLTYDKPSDKGKERKKKTKSKKRKNGFSIGKRFKTMFCICNTRYVSLTEQRSRTLSIQNLKESISKICWLSHCTHYFTLRSDVSTAYWDRTPSAIRSWRIMNERRGSLLRARTSYVEPPAHC